MSEAYTSKLTKFAKFYFENMFKGYVFVDGVYEPKGLYTRIMVQIQYGEIYLVDKSQKIEDYTNTTIVMEILDELTNRLKTQYINKLAEQENILQ